MQDRKAIKFYRSYYDVANELPKKHQGEFVLAILRYQFEGIEPNFKGVLKLAWISQKHSLDKQLEGFKHGSKGGRPLEGTPNPPLKGTSNQVQVQVQEQEKEQVKDKENYNVLLEFLNKQTSKQYRVVTEKTQKQINARLKDFSMDEIKQAIVNCSQDEYHKEKKYKYLTLEYITRAEQTDKWVNVKPKKQSTYIPTVSKEDQEW